MKPDKFKKIRDSIEKEMDEKRFAHTLGVAYTAAMLASIHGIPQDTALLAGLLHDCAKCYSDEKMFSLCSKNNVSYSVTEAKNTALLHGKVGAIIACKKYAIEDETILNAIRYHTTGRPEMTLLDKIIYVADYIEPGRKPLPNLSEIRKLAFQDLDAALIMILENILNYLESCGKETDPATRETYEYYINRRD
ncbi:MAG: bis(5'-nucleosyl)-tetraphosphatase (symmetrical) YqeK [Lachnospiraceae bacterium]|nr:bis(5'-nucleosyl)-tetraphosphatase (symmetrical) YqeK [Lachnospiraceae bacterium]